MFWARVGVCAFVGVSHRRRLTQTHEQPQNQRENRQAQEFKIPKALAATELGLPDGAAALGPVTTEWEEEWVKARVVLTRVGPAKKGDYRTVGILCDCVCGPHMRTCVHVVLTTPYP